MIDTLTGYEQVPYQIENMRTGKRRKNRAYRKKKKIQGVEDIIQRMRTITAAWKYCRKED